MSGRARRKNWRERRGSRGHCGEAEDQSSTPVPGRRPRDRVSRERGNPLAVPRRDHREPDLDSRRIDSGILTGLLDGMPFSVH